MCTVRLLTVSSGYFMSCCYKCRYRRRRNWNMWSHRSAVSKITCSREVGDVPMTVQSVDPSFTHYTYDVRTANMSSPTVRCIDVVHRVILAKVQLSHCLTDRLLVRTSIRHVRGVIYRAKSAQIWQIYVD